MNFLPYTESVLYQKESVLLLLMCWSMKIYLICPAILWIILQYHDFLQNVGKARRKLWKIRSLPTNFLFYGNSGKATKKKLRKLSSNWINRKNFCMKDVISKLCEKKLKTFAQRSEKFHFWQSKQIEKLPKTPKYNKNLLA